MREVWQKHFQGFLLVNTKSYWASRQRLRYYGVVRHWLEALGSGGLFVDVGGANTPVVTWGDFEERIAIDPSSPYSDEGISAFKQDWMEFVVPGVAAVTTCLQVLEHLPDERVVPFARKLLAHTEWAIISVPYLWRRGVCKHHLQDPISREKLIDWCGREPVRLRIVQDGRFKRLVALFEGEARAAGQLPIPRPAPRP